MNQREKKAALWGSVGFITLFGIAGFFGGVQGVESRITSGLIVAGIALFGILLWAAFIAVINWTQRED